MQSDKKFRKWKWILPVMVFVLGCGVLAFILRQTRFSHLHQMQTVTELNAITYAERMTGDLNHGIAITNSLEEILVSQYGKLDNFPRIAEDLMTDAIQSIQLAPDGVVTDIYPEAGNEAGKIDLIHDEARGEICRYGRDNDLTIMQGPFTLKQGGSGIAIRNPVYLKDEEGNSYFWGFTIAIIRVPDIFANSVQALTNFGYAYRLSKTASPLSDGYEEVSSSGVELDNPVSYEFELGGCSFLLEVMPLAGWNSGSDTLLIFISGMLIVLLLTGLTYNILALEERSKILKKLSTTDPLTGLLNRKGFEEQTERFMKNHPQSPCVGIQLDIDDFKFINDIYGHAAGDAALQELAQSMREAFPKKAILSRSGGDEFSLILTDVTGDEAEKRIQEFTSMPRYFEHDGEKQAFHISLGYAGYPADADDCSTLLRNADMALYEVKLQGKHNCLPYRQNFNPQKRSRLGFALRDISQHLPGAFLIYKADPEDDHILFANRELIAFAGCKDMDEFLTYTNQRFGNLIRPDEKEAVEESIWKQINSGVSGSNDYVQFHFAKKDGTYHPVLDHGRIVENTYYGNVFYVLIMDCALIETHYN